MKGKIIQIHSHGSNTHLYALTDQGVVYEWQDYGKYWHELPNKIEAKR